MTRIRMIDLLPTNKVKPYVTDQGFRREIAGEINIWLSTHDGICNTCDTHKNMNNRPRGGLKCRHEVSVVPTWYQPTSGYEARTHRLKKGDVMNLTSDSVL